MAQQNDLFTPLSTDAAATVQGGWGCRRSHRPFYYYSRPIYSRPSNSWGYGYGGWSGNGSSSAVTQTVNVNVLYND